MRSAASVIAVVACLGIAASPRAQTGGSVTEPETGVSFPEAQEFGGVSHVMIGIGPFELLGTINTYTAGFYVDAESAKRSWQRFLRRQGAAFVSDGVVDWAGLKDSASLYQWIASASFGRGIRIRFLYSATRQQIIDLHTATWRRLVDDFDTAVTQSPLKEFVDATCQDVTAGQEMLMWSRGTTVFVELADRPPVKIENAGSIVRAVWGMWFGPQPILPSLRRALVDRIEVLGGPAPTE